MLNVDKLNRALRLLDKRLELKKSSPIDLIVCGGSSLIITGVVSRVTKDVDIVGIGYPSANGRLGIKESNPLPSLLEEVAQEVAQDLGLDGNWLNTGPSDLVKFGLPEGFAERLQPRRYGNILTVHFIGRLDQIYFKVYASVDSGPGRHVEDLRALNPTEEEIESAAKWAMSHDPSSEFHQTLKDMLRKIGYETVSKRI